uniref:Uncharacterized protein n=1 Tax=Romanomermis culicivorax TaxID=13658 RepID=A0A915JSB2_ROMCU
MLVHPPSFDDALLQPRLPFICSKPEPPPSLLDLPLDDQLPLRFLLWRHCPPVALLLLPSVEASSEDIRRFKQRLTIGTWIILGRSLQNFYQKATAYCRIALMYGM